LRPSTWFGGRLGKERVRQIRFSSGLLTAGAVWSGVALAGVLMYTGLRPSKIAISILAAFAAAAVGALVGFLFGVPRSRSDGVPEAATQDGTFVPNTNLEQVSDWLTKIIVGVGLIQFRQIGATIYDMGRAVGLAIGDSPGAVGSSTTFGIALLVGSTLITFLLVYMWTTTRLYEVFQSGNEDGAGSR